MKKTNRVILSFIAIALICACVIFMLAACNFNQQQSVPNNSNGNNTSNNNTSDNNANNDTNIDNNNQPSNPADTDKDEENPEKPDKPVTPPEEQISEAEYKEMFEEKLPTVIEEYFNENLAKVSSLKISDVEIELYNNMSGTIYIKCKQQGFDRFIEMNSSNLAGSNSYESLVEKLENAVFTSTNVKGTTIQEQSLAKEIAAFALEQQEVKDYLSANVIDPTQLKVLNATQFESINGYRTTNLIICSKNSIFNIKLAGRTCVCSTQSEYLNKFKNGYLEKIEIGEAISFEELAIKDDAKAACMF